MASSFFSSVLSAPGFDVEHEFRRRFIDLREGQKKPGLKITRLTSQFLGEVFGELPHSQSRSFYRARINDRRNWRTTRDVDPPGEALGRIFSRAAGMGYDPSCFNAGFPEADGRSCQVMRLDGPLRLPWLAPWLVTMRLIPSEPVKYDGPQKQAPSGLAVVMVWLGMPGAGLSSAGVFKPGPCMASRLSKNKFPSLPPATARLGKFPLWGGNNITPPDAKSRSFPSR
jgi:hypothetical protein